MVLEGRMQELKERLRKEMFERSGSLDYEEAAALRDLMYAVDSLDGKQRVVDVGRSDTDVAGLAREMDRVVIALMFIRGGRMVGMSVKKFARVGARDEEALGSFLVQYYGRDHYVPREILLSLKLSDGKILEQTIMKERGEKVRIASPRGGKGGGLVKMAVENANMALAEWESLEDGASSRLEYIAGRLRLPGPPWRIECVDISHTSGKEVTGSIAVMEEGAVDKSGFKRFKVRAETRGDDFMAMREVLARRFRRGVEGEKSWTLPDLLLVDGGKGHLKMASILKKEFGIEGMAVAAIAKDRGRERRAELRRRVKEKIIEEDRERGLAAEDDGLPQKKSKSRGGFDTIYVEGHKEGIPATRSTPLGLLVRLRDEAHRFAVGYHRKLRGKKSRSSSLLEIDGVGPATVRRLYERYRGPGDIRVASAEEIAAHTGISLKIVEKIKQKLGN
jgi:excinuclease ABC subunit C